MFDDEAEIQDSASWIGLKFSTQGNVKFLAHVEFGLNLIGGVDPFQAGQRTDSGLLTSEDVRDDPPVLGSRLGYVGVDFGAGGRIHLGKDWGQHYAIAGYTTDRWNAFGAQLQFSNSTNDEAVDGYGASLQFTIIDGLKIGGAYTQTEIEDLLQEEVLGVDGDSEYGIVGVSYDSDRLYVGANYSSQKNGDIRQVPVLVSGEDVDVFLPVFFDGNGVEVFVKGRVGNFGITGGYIDYSPDVDVPFLDPDFRIKYFTLGAEWYAFENVYVYTEFKIDDTINFAGLPGSDVGVIGIHYQASGKMRHDP